MKKLLTAFLLSIFASSLYAGGIDNTSNMSAGYMRNPSKNTESKKPDAVFYNPAGTAFLEKGLYIELGNQFIFLNYSADASSTPLNEEFSAVNPIMLYPNGEIVWNAGNYALFAGTGIIANGGKVEYDNGSFSTAGVLSTLGYPGEPHSFDVSAVVYGEVLGASYAVNDKISFSAAVKFAQGKRTTEFFLDSDPGIGTTVMENSESEAKGTGAVFGIHYKASEKFDIALQYQSAVILEYEYIDVEGYAVYLSAAQVAEGNKYNIDLPAVLSSGIGYQISDDLYTSLSFNFYFNTDKSIDNDTLGGAEFDNSWEIAAGADFTFSDMAVLSGGIVYSKQGYKDELNSPESPVLDSLTIASGVGLTFIDDFTLDIGIFKPFHFSTDYTQALETITLKKDIFLIGIGATYKVF